MELDPEQGNYGVLTEIDTTPFYFVRIVAVRLMLPEIETFHLARIVAVQKGTCEWGVFGRDLPYQHCYYTFKGIPGGEEGRSHFVEELWDWTLIMKNIGVLPEVEELWD